MNTMVTKKTLVSCAVATGLGLGLGLGLGSTAATADPVATFIIQDVGSNAMGSGGYSSTTDGVSGSFAFSTNYINVKNYPSTTPFTGDVGLGAMLGGGAANPTGSYSTGFLFSGLPFVPFTFGSGLNADQAGLDGGLTVTTLDFGGQFAVVNDFLLAPGGAFPLQILWSRDQGGGNFDIAMRWGHLITTAEDATSQFTGFTAQWVLEGTVTVDDLKPKITQNPGASEHPSGDLYVDPGATCLDVVDGQIDGNITTTPDPIPPNPTVDFDVIYDCKDSADQDADPETRSITITTVPDITPPDIILDACTHTAGSGIDCSADGGSAAMNTATVDILVGNMAYTDGGGNCDDTRDGPITPLTDGTGMDPVFFSDPFQPDDPTEIDTSSAAVITVDFDCTDTAGNDAATVTRTINVIADDFPPIITPANPDPVTITLNEPPPDITMGITCTDTNPVDPVDSDGFPVDITANLDFTLAPPGDPDPKVLDTGSVDTTEVTYTCLDDAGNPATERMRTYNVISGEAFEIFSMTISDVILHDGTTGTDGLAGCFTFNNPSNPATCLGSNQFSSDGSAADTPGPGEEPGGGQTLPGIGLDVVTQADVDAGRNVAELIGTPVGVRFGGAFQDSGAIAPGFNFAGFPFQPLTFDPPSTTATPPAGFVILAGDDRIFKLDSFPFSGFYESGEENTFFLPPDPGTLATLDLIPLPIDEGSPLRTFQYRITWAHLITDAEDPGGQFSSLTTFWQIEGIVTTSSVVTILNNPPVIKTVSADQDGDAFGVTQIIIKDGGNVTATVVAEDLETDTGALTYLWSGPVTPIGGSTGTSFTFDPAGLPDGPITLTVEVTDDHPTDPLTSSEDLVLEIVTTPPDPDYGDDDNDRIPNYLDNTADPTRNALDPDDPTTEMVVSKGQLRLGDFAQSTGSGSFHITEALLLVDDPASGEDPINRPDGIGHSGTISNFEVCGLDVGESVQIVIPQTGPLTNTPEYRKYKPETGWKPFQATQGNALASTKRVGGVCPGPSSPLYDDAVGLVEGDDCVRVTIVDGTPMDADGLRNGKVRDPSVPAGNGAVAGGGGVSSFGGSGSGSGCNATAKAVSPIKHVEWWILAVFAAGLGWMRRKFRRSSG